MAYGHQSREATGSRFILGDLTNQTGERRSEIMKSFGFPLNGEKGHKRLCISPAGNGGSGCKSKEPNARMDKNSSASLDIHKKNLCVNPSTPDARDIGDDRLIKICTEAVGKIDSLEENKTTSMKVVNDNCPSVTQDKKQVDFEAIEGQYHAVEIESHDADAMFLSQSGSIDCTVLHDSQESTVIGSNVPYANQRQVHEGIPEGIKSCSCSFCSKAALIWLNVQQHDIKVRGSAIKKSQGEADTLARSFGNKEVAARNGDQNISGMVGHLMHQWKSLFERTADVLEKESKELEASLGHLRELRNKLPKG